MHDAPVHPVTTTPHPKALLGWVITTWPADQPFHDWVHALLATQWAACVQVGPPVQSFYPWNGQMASTSEYPVWIKTQPACYPLLEAWIQKNHPYEIPQIFMIYSDQIAHTYATWIHTCTHTLTPEDPTDAR